MSIINHSALGNINTTRCSLAAKIAQEDVWEGDVTAARANDILRDFFENPSKLSPKIRNNLSKQLMTKEARANGGVPPFPPSTYTLRIGAHKMRIYNFASKEQKETFQNGGKVEFINSKGENRNIEHNNSGELIPLNVDQHALFKIKAEYIHKLKEDRNDTTTPWFGSNSLQSFWNAAEGERFNDYEKNKKLVDEFLKLRTSAEIELLPNSQDDS